MLLRANNINNTNHICIVLYGRTFSASEKISAATFWAVGNIADELL